MNVTDYLEYPNHNTRTRAYGTTCGYSFMKPCRVTRIGVYCWATNTSWEASVTVRIQVNSKRDLTAVYDEDYTYRIEVGNTPDYYWVSTPDLSYYPIDTAFRVTWTPSNATFQQALNNYNTTDFCTTVFCVNTGELSNGNVGIKRQLSYENLVAFECEQVDTIDSFIDTNNDNYAWSTGFTRVMPEGSIYKKIETQSNTTDLVRVTILKNLQTGCTPVLIYKKTNDGLIKLQ